MLSVQHIDQVSILLCIRRKTTDSDNILRLGAMCRGTLDLTIFKRRRGTSKSSAQVF